MGRVYNFSAGPAVLPDEVLKQAAQEMLDYRGCGMSVMEMSHRSEPFEDILNSAKKTLKELMNIPNQYQILFLQGGASSQFSMVPLNLMVRSKKADYVNTGEWSKKAIAEAKRFGQIRILASSEDKNFSYIPQLNSDQFDKEADYIHITTNNTIEGTVFKKSLDTGKIPLVADMSSNILSEPFDVTKFGLIYAGAQKNIGPAGVAVVIIREDLLGKANPLTPKMFDYKTHAENNSLYNTPPCYAIYIAKLVFDWLKKTGGIQAIYKKNLEKANLLYQTLDQSKLFKSPVTVADRSLMNIPFTLPEETLTKKFLQESEKEGLVNLKGHRSVGGMRASIYNAMPFEGVRKLCNFIKNFESKNSRN